MKKKVVKKLVILLVLSLFITSVQFINTPVVRAAADPTFNVTKKTIYGIGKSYTIKINNPVAKTITSWSSSNKKVATVTGKGVVKTVAVGTSTIKAKVTLANKKTKTLSCKVTVKLRPSTEVLITVAPEDNTIQVGNTFEYKTVVTPTNTTDTNTWKVNKTSIATVDKKGVVTAKAVGSTVLTVKTSSGMTDSVPIIVTEKVAKVERVSLANGTKLLINFNNPIDKSTVLDSNNGLLNVKITRVPDSKSILANDYGDLTGSLSADAKTLTIEASNYFNGEYLVWVQSGILTTDKIEVSEYNRVLPIRDQVKPVMTSSSIDETGVLAVITFDEPISIDSFIPISPVRLDGTKMNGASSSLLTNKNNYVLLNGRKTLRIDLSNLDSSDHGKMISVQLVGIKDVSSNTMDTITLQLQTNTAERPQAKIVSIYRSAYNIISVFYDKPIKTPGMLSVGNNYTSQQNAIVNKDNYRRVDYKISEVTSLLTGKQEVTIIGFDGYSTKTPGVETKTVDFTINQNPPKMISAKFDTKTIDNLVRDVITLTFDKEVKVSSSIGSLKATLREVNEEISIINIIYSSVIYDKNTISLVVVDNRISTGGTYDINLPKGLVKDADFNIENTSSDIRIIKEEGTNVELPAPTILQSKENPSEITLKFSRKLDIASAENLANYELTGVVIKSAKVIMNNSSESTVKLTIADGTIQVTNSYALIISGIKGYNNSYTAISRNLQLVTLNDNVAPYVLSAKIGSDFKTITVKYSEPIKGTVSLEVNQGSSILPLSTTALSIISNDSIIITLQTTVSGINNLYIRPTTVHNITDYNYNPTTNTTFAVSY